MFIHQEIQAADYDLSGRTILAFIAGIGYNEGCERKNSGDMDAMVPATVNFSRLVAEIGQNFKRIDINPLMVLPQGLGVKALDALFVKKN